MRDDIRQRIESIRRERGDSVPVDSLGEIIDDILSSLKGDISGADVQLHHEVQSLADYIAAARSEISEIRPGEIRTEHLQVANDELDAIVAHTERATGAILDATENLESLAGSLPEESASVINEQVTRIYEACNFQDITGQRITRVVDALKHIESKVAALAAVLGDADEEAAAKPKAPSAKTDAKGGAPSDEDLLNGPQLPDAAQSQEEIDALLASFD